MGGVGGRVGECGVEVERELARLAAAAARASGRECGCLGEFVGAGKRRGWCPRDGDDLEGGGGRGGVLSRDRAAAAVWRAGAGRGFLSRRCC